MKKFVVTILMLFLGALSVRAAAAPTFYFQTSAESIAVNSEFLVKVLLDSDSPINAVRLTINYNASLGELLSVNNGNSIINLWHGNPDLSQTGLVTIEGGISKAFTGKGGEIIMLNFKAKQKGPMKIWVSKANAYLADGKGTAVSSYGEYITLDITNITSSTPVALPQSSTQPNNNSGPALSVQVAKDPYSSANLLIFQAENKESGIKSVSMRTKDWLSWGEWQIVASPLEIKSGTWAIELRALANNGNTAEKTIYIWGEIIKKAVYPLIGLLILFGLIYFIKLHFKRKLL